MKKLYALIQWLLNMLSHANKKIVLLEKKIKSLTDDLMEECYWHDCCMKDRDELYKDNLKLQIKLDEWKKAFDERDNFWCRKFDEQKFWNNQLVLLMKNVLHDQLKQKEEEDWQYYMDYVYDDGTYEEEEEEEWYENMRQWAWELQRNYDDIEEYEDESYIAWVETELFGPDRIDCEGCDGWKEAEACELCRMFNSKKKHNELSNYPIPGEDPEPDWIE